MKIYRSKAPLRLGFAGGGTDVSPYSDLYGGAILNATINLFAYASIIPTTSNEARFFSEDTGKKEIQNSASSLSFNGNLDLLKGVYNRLIKQFKLKPLSFDLHTYVDAPPGSGLGTSSTLVVSVIGAFAEWLKLPLGEYEIAHLAYEIERIDMNMSGGKQDQYACTFGGFNYMEFSANDKVIVNPLRVKKRIVLELENNLLLFYTGTSRLSSKIIDAQIKNVSENTTKSIDAMHKLKEHSIKMKETLLVGDLDQIGDIFHTGWEQKKLMVSEISNKLLDDIYQTAINAGSTGGKISGAGGGGFMFFYCPLNTKFAVKEALNKFEGDFKSFNFVEDGLVTWTS